jgi:protein-arginine kinase activator protein McsA
MEKRKAEFVKVENYEEAIVLRDGIKDLRIKLPK